MTAPDMSGRLRFHVSAKQREAFLEEQRQQQMEAAARVNRIADVEGWGIFNADTTPEIQRDDEADVFASDDEAIEHVRRLAAAGSALHKMALSLVGVEPAPAASVGMFIVSVTEQPRVGQRTPRLYHFAIAGHTEAEARANWQAAGSALIYAQHEGDTIEFTPALSGAMGSYRLNY